MLEMRVLTFGIGDIRLSAVCWVPQADCYHCVVIVDICRGMAICKCRRQDWVRQPDEQPQDITISDMLRCIMIGVQSGEDLRDDCEPSSQNSTLPSAPSVPFLSNCPFLRKMSSMVILVSEKIRR